MKDKIKNNPSFEALSNEIKAIEEVDNLLDLSKIGLIAEDEISILKNEAQEILNAPDLFNKYFSLKGWIAYESMNHNLMLECIELANRKEKELAEEKLADYYTASENIKWIIKQSKHIPALYNRYGLLCNAYEDTKEKRFVSAILILLTVIDGSVNDIDKNTGFFAEKTNLTTDDSIVGHDSGLATVSKIFNQSRKTTNKQEIYLPYRNGILHGRDLCYGNKYVCGKCWAILIAIVDWAKSINDTSNQKVDEVVNELNISAHIEKIKKDNDAISKWHKRTIVIDKDIPSCGHLEDYGPLTPERAVIEILEYWKKTNYGYIAKLINSSSKPLNIQKEAGRVSKIFKEKNLKSYSLISVEDCTCSISEIIVKVEFEYKLRSIEKEVKFRMIYQNEEGKSLVFGEDGGEWKFIDFLFFNPIENVF